MDTRPIGIFDSGLGGLTALSSLSEFLPNENFIYLGDTLRVPYGAKTRDELLKCAEDDIRFLLKKDVKAILIACGTVSSTLSEEELEKVPVLTLGVVIPSVNRAVNVTKNKKIGIIATEASIKAGAYEREIKKLLPDCEVFPVACPEFVPFVEAMRLNCEDSEVYKTAEKYLLPLKEKGIDTLILGCTHYPLLLNVISDILPNVNFINVGTEAARVICDKIEKNSEGHGECDFFVTKESEQFKINGSKFLKKDIQKVYKTEF